MRTVASSIGLLAPTVEWEPSLGTACKWSRPPLSGFLSGGRIPKTTGAISSSSPSSSARASDSSNGSLLEVVVSSAENARLSREVDSFPFAMGCVSEGPGSAPVDLAASLRGAKAGTSGRSADAEARTEKSSSWVSKASDTSAAASPSLASLRLFFQKEDFPFGIYTSSSSASFRANIPSISPM